MTVAGLRPSLSSVATTVIGFEPSLRIKEVLKVPSGSTEMALPLTVTENMPLSSSAVPLTVISLISKSSPSSGFVTIKSGGVLSGSSGNV